MIWVFVHKPYYAVIWTIWAHNSKDKEAMASPVQVWIPFIQRDLHWVVTLSKTFVKKDVTKCMKPKSYYAGFFSAVFTCINLEKHQSLFFRLSQIYYFFLHTYVTIMFCLPENTVWAPNTKIFFSIFNFITIIKFMNLALP